MACEQCLRDDEEIKAIRRRHAAKGIRPYSEYGLPSDDCDRGECQNDGTDHGHTDYPED